MGLLKSVARALKHFVCNLGEGGFVEISQWH